MKLNVYFRYYRAFENVPDEVIPELYKLTLGRAGVMQGYVPMCNGVIKRKVHKSTNWWNGAPHTWVERVCNKCGGDHPNQSWTKPRYIVVAYNGRNDKAIGWTMVEDSKYINLFVTSRWRRKGLATKMVLHGCKKLPKKLEVYNREAAKVVREASARSKFKKVVSCWID